MIQVPKYNNRNFLTVPGKLGIQVYINGTLKYEKYVLTKRNGDTSPVNSSKIVDVEGGGIYNDATPMHGLIEQLKILQF